MPVCHLKKGLLLVLLISNQLVAQRKPIPLQSGLKKITRIYGTQFVYDRQIVEGKTTSYNLENTSGKSAEEVLKAVLYPNELVFLYVKPKYYTIVPRSSLGELRQADTAYGQIQNTTSYNAQSNQRLSITGIITSDAGLPLSGATISEKGTSNATMTKENGSFSIDVQGRESVLDISSVGYLSKEITLGDQSKINISLQPGSSELSTVVVIGYGTARKRDLTGSVARVSGKDVSTFPTTNILQAMQGRAAGVQVSQNNGAPGSAVSVRIRGTNSVLGSNEPLYVIDGFPYSGNPTFLQNGDIQSIEVLKDASSVAIYGSRGANGVILITTKAGRKGNTVVDVETAYSIQSVTQKMKLMNALQYAEFYNEQAANDNLTPYFTQAQLDQFANMASTDWQDLVLRNAPLLSTNVTVGGGNEKTQFSVSGGVFRQEGIINNSDYNRYSLRANLNHDISKMFSISYNATLTRLDSRRQNSSLGGRGGDIISGMLGAPPTLSAYRENGAYRRLNTAYPFISNVIVNPLATINEVSDKIRADRILANAALMIRPFNGFSLRISGGVENSHDKTDFYDKIDSTRSSIGSAAITATQLTSFLNENIANYTRSIGNHTINATAGVTYQDYLYTTLRGSGSGFLNNVTETYNLQGATSVGIPESGYTKWTLMSYLGRLNYTFKDRYLATVSFRRDGSSRYSEDNKWGNFPSAALAWRISEESFMKRLEFISDLKVRSSYGSTGSTAISPYQTLNQLGSIKTVFGDALYNALAPSTTLPGDLKWETTYQWDIGLDAGFLNNRVRLTLDYYNKRTTNLLNRVQLPASTGYTSTVRNIGEIQNNGVEFGLDADILQGNIGWTISTNVSVNRSKVIKLYGGQDIPGSSIYTGPLNDYVNLLREGQPLFVFYGYKEIGYTATGLLQYEDINKDGIISPADKTYIGNPNPDFIYSLNSSTTWKGWELSFFIQGSQGNDIFNLNGSQTIDLGMGLNLPVEMYYNHWTPGNTNTKYPKVTRTINGNISNRFVEDGSYLRFRNIQLAYNLPVAKLKAHWVRQAQVYISGQNLITISKYSWYDPDVNAYGGSNSINQGIDNFSYPNSKSVTFGIRCGF